YDYRKDVRVVNLSLLNTDWYTEQMKNRYAVPISLTEDQIVWDEKYTHTVWDESRTRSRTVSGYRPKRMFKDRPRGRMTYLQASGFDGRVVRVQDMMMDEIILENRWRNPVYFTSPPYAESPLKLRDRATAVGVVYRFDREPPEGLIDAERGYELFMNDYAFDGYEDCEVYRDDNATGVYIGVGINAVRIFDGLNRTGENERAKMLAEKIIRVYPEYWQMYLLLAGLYESEGDSAGALGLYRQLHDTLAAFLETNPENLYYRQDLGLAKVELGSRVNDPAVVQEGIELVWEAFEQNPNSNYSFRKLFSILSQQRRYTDIQRAAEMFAEYKINLNDPVLQSILSPRAAPAGVPPGGN
ncbi:MAG: hypothetical protein AB1744_13215, partial [Candidatus Zixiibacteriota bacterium]